MSRGQRDSGLEVEVGELNLVPYLDIMVNLVLFMLMSITSFLSFTMLNASIPQLSPNAATAQEQLKKKELLLMVRVTKEGFIVDPSVQGGKALPKTQIPKVKGEYQFEALKKRGSSIKGLFPKEEKVLILAHESVKYDDIIKTMDALRDKETDGDEGLFPSVTLSVL